MASPYACTEKDDQDDDQDGNHQHWNNHRPNSFLGFGVVFPPIFSHRRRLLLYGTFQLSSHLVSAQRTGRLLDATTEPTLLSGSQVTPRKKNMAGDSWRGFLNNDIHMQPFKHGTVVQLRQECRAS